MFFQIHRDGQAIDGSCYPTFQEAAMALEKTEQGGQVTEVDSSDKIVRRYTLQESRMAVRNHRQGGIGPTNRGDR